MPLPLKPATRTQSPPPALTSSEQREGRKDRAERHPKGSGERYVLLVVRPEAWARLAS